MLKTINNHRLAIQTGVTGAAMTLAVKFDMFMMASGWGGFQSGVTEFFEAGMANTGLPTIGKALLALGLFGAAITFVIHKVNQQSSLPRPGGFLMIALVGAGVTKYTAIFKAIEKVRDILFGWFGLS